jgi:hypothetical protein
MHAASVSARCGSREAARASKRDDWTSDLCLCSVHTGQSRRASGRDCEARVTARDVKATGIEARAAAIAGTIRHISPVLQ